MASFTTLLNRGRKKYQDKYLKKRKFGKCEGCENPNLLIEYRVKQGDKDYFLLCDFCYNIMISREK
jgi:hypothetical protein